MFVYRYHISILTARTAPTCCDFAASSFFPPSEDKSIEPNSGPNILLLFFRLESWSALSSSFSTVITQKILNNKSQKIKQYNYQEYGYWSQQLVTVIRGRKSRKAKSINGDYIRRPKRLAHHILPQALYNVALTIHRYQLTPQWLALC